MNASEGLIAGYSLTEPDDGWEEILSAFRALGGVADNIRLGRGRLGRGLFPIEPDQPYRLRVPENLLVPVEDVVFVGGRIGIRESSAIPKPEREFFDIYANALTWGGGGRQETSALIAAFDALPNEIRALLVTDFGMGAWFEGEPTTREHLHFVRHRAFGVHGKDVVIPILELANHDCRGVAWRVEHGAELAGQASDEILNTYGMYDPFSIFHRFGFASREPVAFSLPLNLQLGPIALSIGRSFEVVQRGNIMLPRLTGSGTGLHLSFLVLGHPNFPRAPRGTFRALMKPLGVDNVDEEFDRILHANWAIFLKLLSALEAHRGNLIVGLRNMAQYQLEAMSSCVGALEI